MQVFTGYNDFYYIYFYIICIYIYFILYINFKNIQYITTNITIWPYTERARAVSRGQFPQKSATFLGKLANTNLVCANTN